MPPINGGTMERAVPPGEDSPAFLLNLSWHPREMGTRTKQRQTLQVRPRSYQQANCGPSFANLWKGKTDVSVTSAMEEEMTEPWRGRKWTQCRLPSSWWFIKEGSTFGLLYSRQHNCREKPTIWPERTPIPHYLSDKYIVSGDLETSTTTKVEPSTHHKPQG